MLNSVVVLTIALWPTPEASPGYPLKPVWDMGPLLVCPQLLIMLASGRLGEGHDPAS